MKKFFAVAVCCSMMFAGAVIAQDEVATPVAEVAAPPTPDAVEEVVTAVAEATTEEAAPVTLDTPVVQSAQEVGTAPVVISDSIVEGTVVNAPVAYPAPIATGAVAAPVQGCASCGGSSVIAPYASAPVVAPSVVMATTPAAAPYVSAPIQAAPVAAQATLTTPAPSAAPTAPPPTPSRPP